MSDPSRSPPPTPPKDMQPPEEEKEERSRSSSSSSTDTNQLPETQSEPENGSTNLPDTTHQTGTLRDVSPMPSEEPDFSPESRDSDIDFLRGVPNVDPDQEFPSDTPTFPTLPSNISPDESSNITTGPNTMDGIPSLNSQRLSYSPRSRDPKVEDLPDYIRDIVIGQDPSCSTESNFPTLTSDESDPSKHDLDDSGKRPFGPSFNQPGPSKPADDNIELKHFSKPPSKAGVPIADDDHKEKTPEKEPLLPEKPEDIEPSLPGTRRRKEPVIGPRPLPTEPRDVGIPVGPDEELGAPEPQLPIGPRRRQPEEEEPLRRIPRRQLVRPEQPQVTIKLTIII